MSETKAELEALIKEERTLGNFVFDEESQRFTCDVEIVLVVKNDGPKKYRSLCYFFDGYEVSVEEKDRLTFEGEQDEVRAAVIASYPADVFLNYPIVYTNVSCEFEP